MLTPTQVRIAMAMLDISREDVANAAEVHRATISAFLHDNRPISSRTLGRMEQFFKAKGIVFLEAGDPSPTGGEGVRFRHAPSAETGASATGAQA